MTALEIAQLLGLLMSLVAQAPSAIASVEAVVKDIEDLINGTAEEADKESLLGRIKTAMDSLPKPADK